LIKKKLVQKRSRFLAREDFLAPREVPRPYFIQIHAFWSPFLFEMMGGREGVE
jgi:hypothetical protein